jgi:hypothetical protein
VKNIDEVKIFIATNTNKLSLSKVKRTNRGIEVVVLLTELADNLTIERVVFDC